MPHKQILMASTRMWRSLQGICTQKTSLNAGSEDQLKIYVEWSWGSEARRNRNNCVCFIVCYVDACIHATSTSLKIIALSPAIAEYATLSEAAEHLLGFEACWMNSTFTRRPRRFTKVAQGPFSEPMNVVTSAFRTATIYMTDLIMSLRGFRKNKANCNFQCGNESWLCYESTSTKSFSDFYRNHKLVPNFIVTYALGSFAVHFLFCVQENNSAWSGVRMRKSFECIELMKDLAWWANWTWSWFAHDENWDKGIWIYIWNVYWRK